MPAVTVLAAAAALTAQMPQESPRLAVKPAPPRFELSSPLPSAPAVMLDMYNPGANLANETARSAQVQGRVMWIDATANVDRYNSEEKIAQLVAKIKEVGFNTIVLDVKPISGHVIYPSKIAPKLLEWKGKTLPAEFDPVAVFLRECKAGGISFLASLNAFSEGHAMFKVGPGYAKPEWHSLLYEAQPTLKKNGTEYPLNYEANKPADPSLITMYNSPSALPKPSPDLYAVAVDWPRGAVVATSDTLAAEGKPLAIPRRGYVLAGTGEAAQALRSLTALGEKPVLDTSPRFVPISERPDQQVPLMVNPVDQEVQEYELAIMREFIGAYDVDGVLYDDRFRYAGMNADFSELTRARFEEHVGRKLRWPEDVFKLTVTQTLDRGLQPGPYYSAWMAWRARVLRDYMARVRALVQEVRPGTLVGLYAGSWYGEYPAYGANLGSQNLEAGFWFLTPEYQKAGMAELLDLLITGGYYPTPTIYDGMRNGAGIGNNVEAAGRLTAGIARDATWSYVGIMLSQFKDDPERLMDALQAACGSTQGVMVFDLSHDIEPLWPAFARAFAQRREPPHMRPDLLKKVRNLRAEYDKLGHQPAPLIIAQGSAGTGM